ncbi:MAG: alanine--tRNA ligase [Planctomycetota bacterium]
MTSHQLRRAFLDFFASKGCTEVSSDSLVPENDPTLLFTGAGMNQFKEQFMGRNISTSRATSCQKCLRTLDIDIVGTDQTHHTFFEMLGNFSFGDYFKKEAITWAWEFLTEVLEIPESRLQATIYKDDEEAYRVWKVEVGLGDDRITRFDADENFWPKNAPAEGPNGVCGPCSEIFYDTGVDPDVPEHACGPNCTQCERFVEVWNLVFTQYERHEGGKLTDLPSKNIDTGMGMERLTSIIQEVSGDYETDLFRPIIDEIETLAKRKLEPGTPIDERTRFRRISDHIRALCFCIVDGVRPGNEGRGYVLRRLLRRAALDGKKLEIQSPFLHKLVKPVIAVMGEDYPELNQRKKQISDTIRLEEEKFTETLMQGMNLLGGRIEQLREAGDTVLSGEDAFMLYDTYGFPIELARQLLAEEGLTVDEKGFSRCMEAQREKARSGSAISGDIFALGPLAEIKGKIAPTVFTGYDESRSQGMVVAIIKGESLVDQLGVGDRGAVILDRTALYGEAGGQVGDLGELETESGDRYKVENVKRDSGYFLHVGTLAAGELSVGSVVHSTFDDANRRAIRANHTATHLLHKALRSKVDSHIEQAGSLVAPDRLRFDFSHFTGLKADQLRAVEDEVNRAIGMDLDVSTREMPVEAAREEGAVALFGEKYGDTVRVVTVSRGGDVQNYYSKELCGGTHIDRTSQIRLFKIVSEESVAAGVRRITALTGGRALAVYREMEDQVDRLAETLSARPDMLVKRAGDLVEENKRLGKELKKLSQAAATSATGDMLSDAPEVGGTKIVAAVLEATDKDGLLSACDQLKKKADSAVVCLATESDGKVQMILGLTDDVVKRGIKAGDLIKPIAAKVKGGGGGRPNLAQAGGSDPSGLDDAMTTAREVIGKALEG